jgi:hypothetical protein
MTRNTSVKTATSKIIGRLFLITSLAIAFCVAILKDVFNAIYPCKTWFYIMPFGN